METLRVKLAELSLEIPLGLRHLMFHHGEGRKAVYKAMYGQVVYGGKLAPPGSTVVFPLEIRDVVRERFPGEDQGKHDAQYRTDGVHVALRAFLEMPWRPPPKSCPECNPGKSSAPGKSCKPGTSTSRRYKPYN